MLAILHALVAGALSRQIGSTQSMTMPPDFYYTPEQQAQLEQALAGSSGPVFVYVFPSILGVGRVALAWLIMGSLLHLLLTLAGTRGTTRAALNLVAWSALPFGVRDLVRVVYMLVSDQQILNPGLSGLINAEASLGALYAAQSLKHVDLYWVWHILLLSLAVRTTAEVAPSKRWAVILFVEAAVITLGGLPGYVAARLSGLTMIRPFF